MPENERALQKAVTAWGFVSGVEWLPRVQHSIPWVQYPQHHQNNFLKGHPRASCTALGSSIKWYA